MSTIPRSSLCRFVRQRSCRPRQAAATFARGFSTEAQPWQQKPSALGAPSDVSADANANANANVNINGNADVKLAHSELLQALDNVIKVQTSLGMTNTNLSPSKETQNPASHLGTLVDLIDEEKREKELSLWKSKFEKAIDERDAALASKLFYAPPSMVNDGITVDMSLLPLYGKFMSLLHPTKLNIMIDVYHRFEDLYHNAQVGMTYDEGSRSPQKKKNPHLAKYEHVTRPLMLRRIINAVGRAPPRSLPPRKYLHLVSDLSNSFQCIAKPVLEHELYTALMKNLIRRKMVLSGEGREALKQIELEVWEIAILSLKTMDESFLTDNRVIAKCYSDLLATSTYRRQEYLPFQQLLMLLIFKDVPLTPEIVLNIVQNGYPFSNIKSTRGILKSLLYLQQNKGESEKDYILDMGTLEHLCSVSARKGNSKSMNIMMEYIREIQFAGNSHYQPTEGIYESMAQAFVSSTKKEDHLVLALLAEMESNGMKPSYIFLKGIAQGMRTRSTVGRLDLARHILLNGHHSNGNGNEVGVRATTSALNTIISGYADLGLVDRAYQTYTNFPELECEPDDNTYAFLLESLVLNVTTAIPPGHGHKNQSNEWMRFQEDIADEMVEEARTRGFCNNTYLIQSYVQVLCATGSLDKAVTFLHEIILDADEKGEAHAIGEKTFSTVAFHFAKNEDFDRVDEVNDICISSGYRNGFSAHMKEQIERMRNKHSI